MSFQGTSMIFNGIASEEMGLVLYDFSSNSQDTTSFSTTATVSEDRIKGRYRSLFYGCTINTPLSFNMILCAVEGRADKAEPFDRWDMQKIADWLTGQNSYKWLSIIQPDMEAIRYRCIISKLQAVEVAGNKWGFSCTVTCDSPYGYLRPYSYSFSVASSLRTTIKSKSTVNSYYCPTLIVIPRYGGNVSVTISNDLETSTFGFSNLPDAIGRLDIDCENGVITASSGLNPYQYLNYTNKFHFPRLAKGTNQVELSGAGEYTFVCEWPVNIGS